MVWMMGDVSGGKFLAEVSRFREPADGAANRRPAVKERTGWFPCDARINRIIESSDDQPFPGLGHPIVCRIQNIHRWRETGLSECIQDLAETLAMRCTAEPGDVLEHEEMDRGALVKLREDADVLKRQSVAGVALYRASVSLAETLAWRPTD